MVPEWDLADQDPRIHVPLGTHFGRLCGPVIRLLSSLRAGQDVQLVLYGPCHLRICFLVCRRPFLKTCFSKH
jgi:hypothetical protein